MTPEILAVVGVFISLGLSMNAYFVKQLVDSLNQVKIQTAVLIERSEQIAVRQEKTERNIIEVFKRLNSLEIRK